MILTRFILILCLVFVGSLVANSQPTPANNWVRIVSTSSDFSFALPPTDYLVKVDLNRHEIWYDQKGLSIDVTLTSSVSAKLDFERDSKYGPARPEATKDVTFTSGKFVGRWTSYATPSLDLSSSVFDFASPKGRYFIVIRNTPEMADICQRFLRSMRLNGKQIVSVAVTDPAETQVISVKSLSTSEAIKKALNRPEPSDVKMEMGPAPAMGGGAEKSIRSRQLIILSKPRAHFTDKARERGIQGIVKVTVTFLASGTIGAIRITKSLDPGLDKSVFEAAKRIKFLPAEVDGKPVDTKRTFEYGFSIDPQLSTLR